MELAEVVKIIKSPKNKDLLQGGLQYESRLRMYTESLSKGELLKESSWTEFDSFLKTILDVKKYNRIKQFIRFPLTSVDVSESLISDVYKVFEASNSFFNIESVTGEGNKLNEFFESINLVDFVINEGKQVLKNKPNTFVVVDKDIDGEPYLLTLENERVTDFCISDNVVNYISFIHSSYEDEEGVVKKRFAFYCNEYYRVFEKDDKGEFSLLTEEENNIGYCPARMFLTDKVSSKNELNKKIPFTSVLTKLEEYQLFEFYKFFSDHYGPFPIIERIREECSVEDCENGFIEIESFHYQDEEKITTKNHKKCPVCSSKKITGPGTEILLDAVNDRDDENGGGTFRLISPSTDSLEYIANKIQTLEEYIKLKTIGEGSVLKNQAVNKDQVKGSFESKENVLLNIRVNLNLIYEWSAKTLAKAKFGEDYRIFVQVDFGTEYYLVSENELQERYGKAKNNGLPQMELDTIHNQIIETKYRTNPMVMSRMKLIKQLDPLPYQKFEEKVKMRDNFAVTEEEFIISCRIMSMVNRFELENSDLVSFGKLLTLQEKIKIINNEFKNYANEYIEAKPVQPSTEPTEKQEGNNSSK